MNAKNNTNWCSAHCGGASLILLLFTSSTFVSCTSTASKEESVWLPSPGFAILAAGNREPSDGWYKTDDGVSIYCEAGFGINPAGSQASVISSPGFSLNWSGASDENGRAHGAAVITAHYPKCRPNGREGIQGWTEPPPKQWRRIAQPVGCTIPCLEHTRTTTTSSSATL